MKNRCLEIVVGIELVLLASMFLFQNPAVTNEEGEPVEQADESASQVERVAPKLSCTAKNALDQDDMCIWVHPDVPSQSIIISSDKHANTLFVYDLEGRVLQSVPAPHPGNIDVRYGFPLGGRLVDIVAFNILNNSLIRIYQVNPTTRELERVDNRTIHTAGRTSGGTLFRSPKTGRYYVIATTTKPDTDTEQFELADDGTGKVGARKVRSWRIGPSEGAVADDESGNIYIGEKHRGVWEIGGEPTDPAPGRLIVNVGQNGLIGSIKGIAVYHVSAEDGYLILSNQSASNFHVYQRAAPHALIGRFAISGAEKTDGLEVCNANLGPRFPNGVFLCHTGSRMGFSARQVLVTPWDAIVKSVPGQLRIDTAWDWRDLVAQLSPARGESKQ